MNVMTIIITMDVRHSTKPISSTFPPLQRSKC